MAQPYPDGIEAKHARTDAHGFSAWRGLAVLGILVVVGLSGRLGGGADRLLSAHRDGMSLAIETPTILRAGQVFEIHVAVEGQRPIQQPALAFSAPYMRNLTINTVMPEAADHGFAGGAYVFGYDRLDPGAPLRIKLDGQVNPTLAGGNEGWIELRDGKTPLVRIPLEQKILP